MEGRKELGIGAILTAVVALLALAWAGAGGNEAEWQVETARVHLGDQPYALDADGPTLWASGGVVSMREDRVTVLDESTLEEVAVAQAGPGAISVAAGAGIAWVANMDEDSLTRIEVHRRSR